MGRSGQEKIIEKDFLGLRGDTASSEASKHVYTRNRMCDANKHMYMHNHTHISDPHIASQRHTEALVIMKSNIPEDAVQQPASRWLYNNHHRSRNLDLAAMRRADWSNGAGRQHFLSFNNPQGQRLGERVNDTCQPIHRNGHENAVLGSTPSDCILAANSLTYHSGSRMNVFPFIAPILNELALTNRVQQISAASDCWPAGQALTLEPSACSAGGSTSRTLPSDSCIKPSGAQLTIFYAGKVNVYNDVSLIKAEEIMLMASAGNPLPPNMDTGSTKCAPMVRSHVLGSQNNGDPQDQMDWHTCQPDLIAKDQSSFPANIPHVPEVQGSKPNIQSAFLEDEPVVPRALPLARKASLARFLEKRKERVLSKSPYPVDKAFL